MRITGGQARGIPIHSGKASNIRPATDKMRERVFSSLGELVVNASVIDLFAGSGAYGLEALSRGAKEVLFVEKNAATVLALKKNRDAVLRSIGTQTAPGPTNVVRRDVLRFSSETTFDLLFIDPPYPLLRTHGMDILRLAAQFAKPLTSRVILEKPADLHLDLSNWNRLRELGKSGVGEPNVLILSPA